MTTRQLHEDGVHVYDPQTDNWYRFETPELALDYVSAPVELENTSKDTQTEPRGADFYATFNQQIPIGGIAPFVLLPKDPSRREARITVGQDALIRVALGTKDAILSGQGYYLFNLQTLTLEITGELWASAIGNVAAAWISVLTVNNENI